MAMQLKETKEYYNRRFGTLSQQLNEEEVIRWGAVESVLKKYIKGEKLKIADFGCGRGWLSAKLRAFGDVTGFDVSEGAIENAKLSFPDIHFVCLDASAAIPEQYANTFDLVVSSEVIEHIHDQASYAKNIHSLLKSNGTFLITTPNGNWFNDFYTDGREAWKQPVENWLTTKALESLFRHAGCSTIFFTTFNSEWIFNYRPKLRISVISNPLIRKLLKVAGVYKLSLEKLNSKYYGLNSLLLGAKNDN